MRITTTSLRPGDSVPLIPKSSALGGVIYKAATSVSSLSYDELADLKVRADAGDVQARILFEQLEAADKRLAADLCKVFGGKPKKKSKKALKMVGSGLPPWDFPEAGDQFIAAMLNSSDPRMRAMAEGVYL